MSAVPTSICQGAGISSLNTGIRVAQSLCPVTIICCAMQLLILNCCRGKMDVFYYILPSVSGEEEDAGSDWMTCSPFTWTKAQVQSWLRWAWQHYNIPGEYDPEKLDLTGPELCVFTLEELKSRSEHGGKLPFYSGAEFKSVYGCCPLVSAIVFHLVSFGSNLMLVSMVPNRHLPNCFGCSLVLKHVTFDCFETFFWLYSLLQSTNFFAFCFSRHKH